MLHFCNCFLNLLAISEYSACIILYIIYTIIQKFGVSEVFFCCSFFLLNLNIQEGCIKLIKTTQYFN